MRLPCISPYIIKKYVLLHIEMKANLYIIAGCNGAGKTTASYTILPEILDCKEFVNADEIAKGLSPFQPEKASIEAGRIMLLRIKTLLQQGCDFAFETTLSSKSYHKLVKEAQISGYYVTLVFFWLNSVDLAYERVKLRVLSGGHNIPTETIRRRYYAGIKNLSKIYIPICDNWMVIDNSIQPSEIIAQGAKNQGAEVFQESKYKKIFAK